MTKEYIKKLENIIKQTLQPLKGVPLNLVIEGISGKRIIPFNQNSRQDSVILEKLKQVAETAGKEIISINVKAGRY